MYLCCAITQRLYGLGARKMVFHGLAPLGCIPSQRVKSKNGQCLKRVNQLVREFNSQVQKLLVSLNSKLPGAQLGFADSYQIVMDLIVNPQAYGNKTNHICTNRLLFLSSFLFFLAETKFLWLYFNLKSNLWPLIFSALNWFFCRV